MKTSLDQSQLLNQLQKLGELARSGAAQETSGVAGNSAAANAEFGGLLTKALNTVNQHQQAASQAASQIETGDGGTSLVKAMIASQKANVAFQATVQVRNRVVSAYQDIMNMPI